MLPTWPGDATRLQGATSVRTEPRRGKASILALHNVVDVVTVGSASGSISIALQIFGQQFRGLAEAQGISLELMHRVTKLAAGGFDSLPHNGTVITVLAICGLDHRHSYNDIFVVGVLIPIVALIVVIVLGTFFGGF